MYVSICLIRVCITVQGIESLVPFVTNSKLSLTLDDLVLVLKEPNPLSVHLSQDTQDSLTHLGECATDTQKWNTLHECN